MSHRCRVSRTSRAVRTALLGIAAVTTALLPAAAAHAGQLSGSTLVRAADLLPSSGTRSGGTMSSASDHVQVSATDAGDVARATFPVQDPDFVFGFVEYSWSGSRAEPSIRYDVDVDGDGDGRSDAQFLGQHQFGSDVYLNESSARRTHRSASCGWRPPRPVAAPRLRAPRRPGLRRARRG